jgi:hypothetical protein
MELDSDLSRNVEQFVSISFHRTTIMANLILQAKEFENQLLVTEASRAWPFEVACRAEDVLQLKANVRLQEDFANMIVGLIAPSASDNTVYLGIHKYESMRDGHLEQITAQVEHIPKVGRWFLVICYHVHYKTVEIDWGKSTISIFDPQCPVGRPAPNQTMSTKMVYDVSAVSISCYH